MRRSRAAAGGTLYANRANGAAADPLSLIRSFDSESIPTRPVRPSPLSASTFHGLPLDLLDRLRSFPLFISAPDSFLAAIGSHLRPQLHNPHDYILNEGDDAKAMYWLVRGALTVTSRDGESTYAELKPGAFFGEIGILMDIPRTATIVAKLRSLVVRLNKEDLQKILPNYPEVERAIREEAQERLTILERKKKELGASKASSAVPRIGKRPRSMGDEMLGEAGIIKYGEILVSSKKRKSPSPSLTESLASSALGSGSVNVRQLLRELPLFATLPPEILHFIGLNAQPRSYPPFNEIIKQGSTGRDVYFIVRGEVEVVSEKQQRLPAANGHPVLLLPMPSDAEVKARLRPGQYFGEVTSLSLAPRRTATVRSVSSVEALMITGHVLDELWQRCGPELRRQVEKTARDRLKSANDVDVQMTDVDSTPAIGDLELEDARPLSPATKGIQSMPEIGRFDEPRAVESVDPDPYLNVDLENVRSRSRRGSLAPPSPSTATPPNEPNQQNESPSKISVMLSAHNGLKATLKFDKFKFDPVSPRKLFANKRARTGRLFPKRIGVGRVPDQVLVLAFQRLDVYDLMKLRLVSVHWAKLISTNNDLLHNLDLTPYSKFVNDQVLSNIICPFVGSRPRHVDISNCFHLTDEGFSTLANTCAASVKSWRMKSVWDITGQAVLEMTNKAKNLEDIDLSNCRKVGDNLLARVLGWVVPDLSPAELVAQQQRQAQQMNRRNGTKPNYLASPPPQAPVPGTVIGCPNLKRLTLSYCKHITDRSMAHIATHAASRIEEMDLTRCTTITDQGFQSWSVWTFPRLTKLCLADCTYLTDNAIVCLTHAARGLKFLDLSFCCALSDIATEVLALGCPSLQHLNLAFCGSAVSDSSLRVIGRHLLELRALSVRGCVRVTGVGVEAVVDGCERLESFDVSQCRNLTPWLENGGREGVWERGRDVKFSLWMGECGSWGL